jgi:hypothetical protein
MRKLLSFVSVVTLGAACSSQGGASAMDTSALTGATTTASTTSPAASQPGTTSPNVNPPANPPPQTPVTPTSPTPTNDTDGEPDEASTTEVTSADTAEVTISSEPDQVSTDADQTTAPPVSTCVDVPDPEQTCATRKEWGNCEQQWLIDANYCAKTCGRCTDDSPPPVGTTPDEPDQPDQPNETPMQDSRFPPLNGGGDGHATRYWDCAKPSCGWSNNAGGHPVRSCDRGGSSLGPTEAANGLQGGPAFTCMSWAPWAKDSNLAFGFVASHTNATCGKCYQLQFTGQGQYNDADPGSVALKNKTMVVMATNIGGDVGGFQFDTLIPGGGVGLNNACDDQQVPFDQQNQNGGLLNRCMSQTDLSARKACVREQCEQTFSGSNVADLKEGCLWFVDWYNAADNPKFWSKEVPCPQELSSIAY